MGGVNHKKNLEISVSVVFFYFPPKKTDVLSKKLS